MTESSSACAVLGNRRESAAQSHQDAALQDGILFEPGEFQRFLEHGAIVLRAPDQGEACRLAEQDIHATRRGQRARVVERVTAL